MSSATSQPCEIIAIASGKGGTGKTLILGCLGYALQQAEHRVLFVDADTATNGLSLFLLGPGGWQQLRSQGDGHVYSRYLERFASGSSEGIEPLRVNRREQTDHGQYYNALISGVDLYGELESESARSADPVISRPDFQAAVRALFDDLRKGDWDYVLVDTRGGFGFNTTDVCALADTFVVVTEPDFTSLYQVRNLFRRIASTALSDGKKAICRGVIVNKASEGIAPVISADGTHRQIDLDRVEASFRSTISADLEVPYKNTYPIPLDFEAVMAYKAQLIPYRTAPASLFSYASLTAFGDMLSVVTVKWSFDRLEKWNQFVDGISVAIRKQSEEGLEAARRIEQREAEIETGRKELADLKTRLETSERNAKTLQAQLEREIERQQTVLAHLRFGRETDESRPASASGSNRSLSATGIALLLSAALGLIGLGIIGGIAMWKAFVETPTAVVPRQESTLPPRAPDFPPPSGLSAPSAAPSKLAPPLQPSK